MCGGGRCVWGSGCVRGGAGGRRAPRGSPWRLLPLPERSPAGRVVPLGPAVPRRPRRATPIPAAPLAPEGLRGILPASASAASAAAGLGRPRSVSRARRPARYGFPPGTSSGHVKPARPGFPPYPPRRALHCGASAPPGPRGPWAVDSFAPLGLGSRARPPVPAAGPGRVRPAPASGPSRSPPGAGPHGRGARAHRRTAGGALHRSAGAPSAAPTAAPPTAPPGPAPPRTAVRRRAPGSPPGSASGPASRG